MVISYISYKKQVEYEEDIKRMSSKEKKNKLEELRKKNEELANNYIDLNDPFYLGKKEGSETIVGDSNQLIKPIGSIAIPKQNIFLSIFEGTEDEVLKHGVGYMRESSYPIGGENTHSVLTAHTGLHSSRLFTDLINVKKGEKFFIKNINGIMAYEVKEINIVLPNELKYLSIQSNRDLVTLMTCTPEGINTHRLLVLGERVPYIPDLKNEYEEQIEESKRDTRYYNLLIIIGVIISIIIVYLLLKKTVNSNKRGSKECLKK